MLNPFAKRMDPHVLAVGMVGVKMGDRLILIGCPHGGRLGAVAGKVGLSGRALAVVPDDASAARARKGAADAGVLVEVVVAPPTALTAEDAGFDVAVVDETGGAFAGAAERDAAIRELARVVRPGGRVVFIAGGERGGLAGLLGAGGPPVPAFATSTDAAPALAARGFMSIRTLAEREGLVFVEAIKRR